MSNLTFQPRQEPTRIASMKDSFIFATLKQLAEGSCCRRGEEQVCTGSLLPWLDQALHDHIAFEEKQIFPQLSSDQLKILQREHKRLLRMLTTARLELECGYVDSFQTYLKELYLDLKRHYEQQASLGLAPS